MIEIIDDMFIEHGQMLEDYYSTVQKAFGSAEWDKDVIVSGTGIQLRGADLLDTTNYNLNNPSRSEWAAIIEKYSFWNDACPEYTKMSIESLSDYVGFKVHRARYLMLLPGLGLPIHTDPTVRYHFPLITNSKCIFGTVSNIDTFENPQIEHMPINNYFYQVDTTKPHFVFNAGREPRIHLVIS